MHENCRATVTLYLSFMTFVFLTAKASNLFGWIEELLGKPYISTSSFNSCRKVARRVFEVVGHATLIARNYIPVIDLMRILS